jgi:hypothetical protein
VFEFDVRLVPEPDGGCGVTCDDSVFDTDFIKGPLQYSADVYGGVSHSFLINEHPPPKKKKKEKKRGRNRLKYCDEEKH